MDPHIPGQSQMSVDPSSGSNTGSTVSIPVQVLHALTTLSHDSLIPHQFSGGLDIDATLQFTSWIKDIRATIAENKLSNRHAIKLIQNCAVGEARSEVDYFLDVYPNAKVKDVISRLEELYSCKESYGTLMAELFNRKQGQGEHIQDFAQDLQYLGRRLLLADHSCRHYLESHLKNLLVDGLYNEYHKAMAKGWIEDNQLKHVSFAFFKVLVMQRLGCLPLKKLSPSVAEEKVTVTEKIMSAISDQLTFISSSLQNVSKHARSAENPICQHESIELYIGNLSKNVTRKKLRNILRRRGPLLNFYKSPKKNFAFATYVHRKSANQALKLNGVPLEGRSIRVKVRHSSESMRQRNSIPSRQTTYPSVNSVKTTNCRHNTGKPQRLDKKCFASVKNQTSSRSKQTADASTQIKSIPKQLLKAHSSLQTSSKSKPTSDASVQVYSVLSGIAKYHSWTQTPPGSLSSAEAYTQTLYSHVTHSAAQTTTKKSWIDTAVEAIMPKSKNSSAAANASN